MPNAQLRNQSVDRARLNTALATSIAKLCSGDVIFTIRIEQRKGREMIDDQLSRPGAGKPL